MISAQGHTALNNAPAPENVSISSPKVRFRTAIKAFPCLLSSAKTSPTVLVASMKFFGPD